jgi:hypothetical protein
MRYAASDAQFSVREIDVGMTADVGTLQRLPRLVPDGTVRELAYLRQQNEECKTVDCVCVFDEDTPIEFLKSFQPSIHVKGGDYKVEQLPETKVLNSWNAKVVILPFVEGYSTSEIIEKSKKRSS